MNGGIDVYPTKIGNEFYFLKNICIIKISKFLILWKRKFAHLHKIVCA